MRTRRKSITAFTALASVTMFGSHADAALIAYESFEGYSVGANLNAGTSGLGWSTNWATNASNVTVETISLGTGSGTKAARISGAAGDIVSMLARNIPSTSGGSVYMAVLTRVESFEDDDFLNLQLTGGASGNVADTGGIGYRNAAGNPLFVRSGTSGTGVTTDSISGADNTNFLLVAKFTQNAGQYEVVNLFINPVSGVEPAPTVTASSAEPSHTALTRFNVRDFNPEAGDVKYIDQIRIATTFSEAVAGLATAKTSNATLNAFADAHVQSGTNGNTNFNQSTLAVKNELNNAGDFHRKAYMQFDLSAVDTSALSTATFNLTIAPPAGGADPAPLENWTFALYGVRDDFAPAGGKLDEGWLETALTWNNAPGNNTANGSGVVLADMFGGQELATFNISGLGVAGTVISLDDPRIRQFIMSDVDGVASFVLVRLTQETSGNSVVHAFHSSESTGGTGPQLVLASVPEPASLSLLMIAAPMLGLRRRRD